MDVSILPPTIIDSTQSGSDSDQINDATQTLRQYSKRNNLISSFLYSAVGLVVVLLPSVDAMWIAWGRITFLSAFLTFLVNLKYTQTREVVTGMEPYVSRHVVILTPMVQFSILGCILTGIFGVPITKRFNKDRVRSETIPTLQNLTLSWCITTCPTTNNLSSTCNVFNQIMLNTGTLVESTLPECLDRSIKICTNATIPSIECANKWASFNYAIANNDANTERDYRIMVNLLYGFSLNLLTTFFYWLIASAIFKWLETCNKQKPRREQISSSVAISYA